MISIKNMSFFLVLDFVKIVNVYMVSYMTKSNHCYPNSFALVVDCGVLFMLI